MRFPPLRSVVGPVLALLALPACKGEPIDAPWCADGDTGLPTAATDLTWHGDIAPIVEQKCLACHGADAHASVTLATYEDVRALESSVRSAVLGRRMPPWLAADCCAPMFQNYNLTDEERAALIAWIDAGSPEGDADAPGASLDPIGGLSRVDLTVTMPEPYTPRPTEGIDDIRCFLLDWPVEGDTKITGLAPRPGSRDIVHHLVVASVGEEDVAAIEARDALDETPGFDCVGGLGDFPTVTPLGGSLLGGDYPRGLGNPMGSGRQILLQVHYAVTGDDTPSDQTAIDFRLDETATEAGAIVVSNPAWVAGETMLVPAGAADEGYWYSYQPILTTGGKPVDLQGVTPHLHRYGSRMRVLVVHADGSTTCLLEIPDWDFGWEQPYWLAEPVRFEPDDSVYIECRYDNSAANQPGGDEPRDFAWGEDDQDMCAAFIVFSAVDE